MRNLLMIVVILGTLYSAGAGPQIEGPDWPARLLRAQEAFHANPSPEGLCELLDTLALCRAAGGRASESLPEGLLEGWLALARRQNWSRREILRLSEHAGSLGEEALVDSLVMVLLLDHPESGECWDAMQSVFLGALYPVWRDDSARVAVMEEFMLRYGRLSNYWRSRALGVMVAALRESGDSAAARSMALEWVADCPESPSARLSAGRALIEDSLPRRALAQLEAGLSLLAEYAPPGMPVPEMELALPRAAHDLQHQLARALAACGDTAAAIASLEPLVVPGLYADSLHHTAYDYLVESAELRVARGDTAEAVELLVRAEVAGRVRSDSLRPAHDLLARLLDTEDVAGACREAAGYSGPVFEDVTASMLGDSGLPRRTRVAWGDYDRDGWPDLLLGRRLFRNREGRGFREITLAAGLRLPRASGAVWGDMDGDGWRDLVTCGDVSRVVLNAGGVFETRPALWQPADPGGPTEGVALLDWNGDGRLDVYLARYERPHAMGLGTPDLFLLGGHNGLRPAGDSLGMDPPDGIPLCGRGVSPCDYDRDGRTDILVSNYRLDRNLLWKNLGPAEEMAMEAGIERNPVRNSHGHTIGSAWADWDNDGDWDLFCANLAHPRYIRFSQRSVLLRNDGGVFTDATDGSGLRYEETHSVPVWGDFDCDGLQDLFITSVYEGRRSFLYRNLGGGRFRDVTFLAGCRITDGWGAAAADFDRDGRLDLAVGAGDGPHILRNVGPASDRWLLVHVRPGRRPAVGCVLEVRQEDAVLLRQVEGGGGTTCQSSEILHLALPEDGGAEWSLFLPGDSLPAASGRLQAAGREITVP